MEREFEAPGCGQRAAARESCSTCKARPGQSGYRGSGYQAARCPQATWRSPDVSLEGDPRWTRRTARAERIAQNASHGSDRTHRIATREDFGRSLEFLWIETYTRPSAATRSSMTMP